MATRKTAKEVKASQESQEAKVEETKAEEIQAVEEVQAEQEAVVPEVTTVEAVMMTTVDGIGQIGEVVTLTKDQAKRLYSIGWVDTHPDAVANAQKA